MSANSTSFGVNGLFAGAAQALSLERNAGERLRRRISGSAGLTTGHLEVEAGWKLRAPHGPHKMTTWSLPLTEETRY